MAATAHLIPWTTGSGNIVATYEGDGDETVVIGSDTDNESYSARSQVLTFTTTAGGTVTKTVTITQEGKIISVGDVFNFQLVKRYTSVVVGSQAFTPGIYKLQVWGAQGGSSTGTYAATGSKGGYSEGILVLTQTTTLYFYIGGKGATVDSSVTSSNYVGGANGGGKARAYYNTGSYYSYPRPGGGATDISLVYSSSSTASFTRTSESLLSRIIVAGGGAGSSYYREVAASYASTGVSVGGGTAGGGTRGGTQTSAGSGGGFGYGAQQTTAARCLAGAGGGGWYGGGTLNSSYQITSALLDGGGGGSGFVNIAANSSYRPTGYTGIELQSGATYDGTISFPSPTGGVETGHEGDGYARVTCMGNSQTVLPAGYTALDYIGSGNSAYINTGVNAANDVGIHIEYEDNFNYGSVSNYVVGARQTSSSTILYAISGSSSGNTTLVIYNGTSVNLGITRTQGKKYVVDLQASSTGLDYMMCTDNTFYGGTVSANFTTSSVPICLFGFNSSNIKKNTHIYKCYILKGGTCVRYFIPCKNESNVVGMYDAINGVFYGSSNSNTFVAGNVIS